MRVVLADLNGSDGFVTKDTSCVGVSHSWMRDIVGTLDRRVARRHARAEISRMTRPVTCWTGHLAEAPLQ